MASPIEIDVWQGEIAELEVDALVVPANESLFMTAGAAASVKRNGGEEIERDAVDQGPAGAGTAIATHAGSLAAAYVIHAVGVGHERVADPEQLAQSIRAALSFATPLQLRRIAVALIGTEHGAFTPSDAAQILLEQLFAVEAGAGFPEWVVVATATATETRAVTEALVALRSHAT